MKCNWKNEITGDGAGMLSPWVATAYNVLLLFVVYGLARVEFLLENYSYFSESIEGVSDVWRLLCAGAVFDSPGILYTNAIYILLMLLPLHYKEHEGYYRVCKWVYITVNSLALLINVADSVYFPYVMKRTTWDTLSEFGNESNLAGIFGIEVLHHWYLLIFTGLVIWGMWRLYAEPSTSVTRRGGWRYYIVSILGLLIAACIVVSGIRGGWLNRWYLYLIALCLGYMAWRMIKSDQKMVAYMLICGVIGCLVIAPCGGWRHRDIRPIALSNANAYAERPIETALILNTPFAMMRTINSQSFVNPHYFEDDAEALSIFTPVHNPTSSGSGSYDGSDEMMRTYGLMRGRNVVVIILESFGEEYIGALNRKILGRRSVSYTPFLDSLISVSTRWRQGYDNGTKSIDAMPSVFASIPKMGKPFVLTSSAMQPIDGLPSLLKREGYETAFFHGARTGSMGFDGFARLAGFDHYYGREDFDADKRFDGDKDFDGYWAIWDEPFMQYYALKMNDLKQPFMSALFSASSHHPFRIPEDYEGRFAEGTLPIHKTIGYSDMALRRFFETARRQPWYENTLFVITNDHTNARDYDEYRSDIGAFHGPILIYDPSGVLPSGVQPGIAQQIDIMPTVLGLLGYKDEYVAYGDDLFDRSDKGGRAVNYINNVYQWIEEGYVLQFDGEKSVGLYREDDMLMSDNMISRPDQRERVSRMERNLKGMLQTYMSRGGR